MRRLLRNLVWPVAFDIHGPLFTLACMVFSEPCKLSNNKPTYFLNENYPKKDSPPSNGGGPDDQCDRPESTNADSTFPSG